MDMYTCTHTYEHTHTHASTHATPIHTHMQSYRNTPLHCTRTRIHAHTRTHAHEGRPVHNPQRGKHTRAASFECANANLVVLGRRAVYVKHSASGRMTGLGWHVCKHCKHQGPGDPPYHGWKGGGMQDAESADEAQSCYDHSCVHARHRNHLDKHTRYSCGCAMGCGVCLWC